MRRLVSFSLPLLLSAASLPVEPEPVAEVRQEKPTTEEMIEPLSTIIGEAESESAGGYDAANNGYPFDLGRDGFQKVFGRPASQVAVGEILLAQEQGRIHAVGRYQIIGITLSTLVRERCLSGSQLFTDAVQDQALICLIQKNRPAIWAYITTGYGLQAAADALAMEFASMPWRDGRSYYGGADRARTTNEQVLKTLREVRQRWKTAAAKESAA